jgi:NAD(P)-dependent dehydrogenase (short-subunit alcohol dehydrogenase family)
MAKVYAAEVAHTNVHVHVFDPGRVRTAMRAQAYPGEDPLTLPLPDEVAAQITAMCL